MLSGDLLPCSVRLPCLLIAVSSLALCPAHAAAPAPADGPFTPDWKSLASHQTPEWYRDAKFGIFMHWGVQSLPSGANDGWYAKHLYVEKGAPWGNARAYHLEHYGHPSTFGYKDMIPFWKAERWDPEDLVAFYQHIGARYIVPVAVHHDNFDLYASKYQPWNSVALGPKRDIVGEWKKAAQKHGLRFGVSSHADRTWDWFAPSRGADTEGAFKGVPYDGTLTKADGKGKWWEGLDPADLYGPPHLAEQPSELGVFKDLETYLSQLHAYREKWYARTRQLIEDYQPDLLYFDSPMPLGGYGLRIASQFYNQSKDSVLNIKVWEPTSVPDQSAVVLDIEKGLSDHLRPFPWQTDTSLNHQWFLDNQPLELSDETVVHQLVDIVSKNGNLLLNVALRPDGTLPDNQRAVLESVGDWLRQNGEAIYGTRPWKTAGEGPTTVIGGDFQQRTSGFTAADIRYTTHGDTLYATLLGWPADGVVHLRSLTSATSIELLGTTEHVTWENGADGITVHLPAKAPGKFAYPLRIRGHDSLFAPNNLLAWCLLPYDSMNRTPAERLAMLKRLGFTQYAWDCRQRHLKDLPVELKLSRETGIQIRAVWLWIDDRTDGPGRLNDQNRAVIDAINEAKMPVEFWVGFNANVFDGLDETSCVKKGAAIVTYLRDLAAVSGSTVALYNHGDWFGHPENELKILHAVGDKSIGIVFNFHHAHYQLDQFPVVLPQILPYLRAVNLDGVRPAGPKILPIGSGTEERRLLKILRASGYRGPLGILGHTEGEDVELVLKRNLSGLKEVVRELEPSHP